MSRKSNEINDNEIRIISADETKPTGGRRRRLIWAVVIVAALIAVAVVVIVLRRRPTATEIIETPVSASTITDVNSLTGSEPEESPTLDKDDYIVATDTVVNRKGLLILWPGDHKPRLIIGDKALDNGGIVLATQAADIREDNGEIAGTFVLDGELVSKGEAKAGFCAIINGELTIGFADATPLMEEALTSGGYFFRQYPLVVGGQLVENKPKGKAIRKALAELDGKICVVMSKESMTFHDFSQLLIDAGVRNAIYLVGSTSSGFYVDKEGNRVLTGQPIEPDLGNYNFIVWE